MLLNVYYIYLYFLSFISAFSHCGIGTFNIKLWKNNYKILLRCEHFRLVGSYIYHCTFYKYNLTKDITWFIWYKNNFVILNSILNVFKNLNQMNLFKQLSILISKFSWVFLKPFKKWTKETFIVFNVQFKNNRECAIKI